MKNIYLKIIIALTLAVSISCHGLRKNLAKRKIERLTKKYNLAIDTLKEVTTDTLFKIDTFTIPEKSIDTLFKWRFDTTYVVEKDGVETKILITKDTVKLNVLVHKQDTVYRTKEVVRTIEKIVKVNVKPEPIKKPWYYWVLGCLILIFVIMVLYVLQKIFNV